MTQEYVTNNVTITSMLSGIQRKSLDDNDLTCKDTDRNVSFKVVNENDQVLMLIEALKGYIDRSDLNNEKHGCFIKRFIVEKEFVETDKFLQCLKGFVSSVQYAMVESTTGTYLARYKYIWARKMKGQACLVAKYLNLKLISEYNDILIYKSDEINN